MVRHEKGLFLSFLPLGIFGLIACQNEQRPPPRFSYETYRGCQEIERVLQPDYVGLARRRFSRGQNVFLYKSTDLGSSSPFYDGIQSQVDAMSESVRESISEGGSWEVKFPDTGCPNISYDMKENYVDRYNRFAITLFYVEK